MNKNTKIILLFILVIGCILRLNNLRERSLWTDEFFTFFQSTGHGQIQSFLDSFSNNPSPNLFTAKDFKLFLKNDPHRSLKDVSQGLIKEDTHPPLYFMIMYLWMKLFGDSVLTVRLFSVLTGLCCILLIYKVSLYLFDEKAAIFSALFVSISPFAVRYSQEARAYSLVMAIGLASWLAVLRFERHRKVSDLIWFTVLNCFGILTHYFYIFVSCAQFLYFTIGLRKNGFLRQRLYLAFLVSVLAFFSWFLLFNLKTYNYFLTEWAFGHPGLITDKVYDMLTGIARYLLIFDGSQTQFYLLFTGLLLFVYILLGVSKNGIRRYSNRLFYCALMLLVPMSAMFFIDVVGGGILLKQERFGTFSFLGFIPLAGYVLSNSFLKRRLAVFLFMLFMLASSFLVVNRQFGPAPQHICSWINQESKGKTSAVIVCNIRCVVAAQAYYLDDNVYIVPVASKEQLENGIRAVSNFVDKVFIVRHYHRADATLMDRSFMGEKNIDSGFKFKTEIERDDISAAEYVKCGL